MGKLQQSTPKGPRSATALQPKQGYTCVDLLNDMEYLRSNKSNEELVSLAEGRGQYAEAARELLMCKLGEAVPEVVGPNFGESLKRFLPTVPAFMLPKKPASAPADMEFDY